MPDVYGSAIAALQQQSRTAAVLVFLAGIASSIGPCVAPRFIALSACMSSSRRPELVVGAFMVGLIAAYVSFGVVASLLGSITQISTFVYIVVAIALFIGGVRTLTKADTHCHTHDDTASIKEKSLGGIALLGASFAFVVSPCCTPLVAAILAYTSSVGHPAYGALLLGLFAIGHASPLFLIGSLGAKIMKIFKNDTYGQAISVGSGSLMLFLAVYYAVLA